MPKQGWLYRQFDLVEKDSETWPNWMREDKIKHLNGKNNSRKKESEQKAQKK